MYKIPANTLFLGKNLVFVPECHSTNTLALEMSQLQSMVDGTVIITANQTSGRGQRGNTWIAEPGKNLTFSLVLKTPALLVRDQFALNTFVSLAVADFVQSKVNGSVKIKWPNDIMVNQKKICGILIENQIQGQQVSQSIIGIGLNVNQKNFNLIHATSMALETMKDIDLNESLGHLLSFLEARLLQLRQQQYQLLRDQYVDRMYWLHEERTFTSNNLTFNGKISGLSPEGRLVILTRNGTMIFDVKEVAYIQ